MPSALSDFRRFPTWMWRNVEVAEFVTLLREYNDLLAEGATRIGFYGLDLYSLYTSMEAVVAYLETVDPDAAQRARERYACFDQFGRDPQIYAYEAGMAGAPPREAAAGAPLVDCARPAARAVCGPAVFPRPEAPPPVTTRPALPPLFPP